MMIVEGRQEYLFCDSMEERMMYRPHNPKDHRFSLMIAAITRRHRMCESVGALYQMFVAPEKQAIYSDVLPPNLSVSRDRNIMAFLDLAAGSGVKSLVCYPAQDLIEGRRIRPTYGKGESHWNGYGAYLAYLALCKSLMRTGRKVPLVNESDLAWEFKENGHNDLGVDFDPPRAWPFLAYKKLKSTGRGVFDNCLFNIGNVKVFCNPNKDLPSMILFRDSFSNLLIPLLVESFRRIIAVASWNFSRELIVSEKPDFVVTQVAERFFLPGGSLNVEIKSFESFTKVKLEDLLHKGLHGGMITPPTEARNRRLV